MSDGQFQTPYDVMQVVKHENIPITTYTGISLNYTLTGHLEYLWEESKSTFDKAESLHVQVERLEHENALLEDRIKKLEDYINSRKHDLL
jgi:hypothetical protein